MGMQILQRIASYCFFCELKFALFVVVGKGAVYSYDPVGSYERETFRAAGSAGSILQPLLDNQVSGK